MLQNGCVGEFVGELVGLGVVGAVVGAKVGVVPLVQPHNVVYIDWD